jgi:subtilisin-like proprotein convertase family protein
MRTLSLRRLGTALCALLVLGGASDPAWSQGSLATWVDACELPRDLEGLMQYEALIVHEDALSQNHDGSWDLFQQPYTHTGIQSPQPICTDSIFYGQPQVSGSPFRSAVRVGPDLVLTAWHGPAAMPFPYKVVFGLRYRQVGDSCIPPDFTHIPADKVFAVKDVVADGVSEIGLDYLLLRLDNEVSDTFLRVRRSGRGRVGDDLTMIGHPDRLATKVDLAGRLAGTSALGAFELPMVADLHTLVGSSGSMVYNRDERFVEAVAAWPVGVNMMPVGPDDPPCRKAFHTSAPSFTNYSVKHFAPFIPAFELVVDPLDTIVHVGPVGGPFTNPSTARTVRAPETALSPIAYQIGPPAETSEPRLVLSVDGAQQGTLPPGASFGVHEGIAADAAPCGITERTYTVTDATNGYSDTIRHVFEIGVREFTVDPTFPMNIADIGAPVDGQVVYTVTNLRPSPYTVVVTADQPWVRFGGAPGPASVPVPGGGSATVTVGIDPAFNAAYGAYPASLTFAATDTGCPAPAPIVRHLTFEWGTETITDAANAAIPDGSSWGLIRELEVTESFCIDDVDVNVVAGPVLAEELRVRLVSPEGTERTLWDHGDNGGFPLFVTFDDEGFAPVQPLSALDGESGAGTWRLEVVDDVPGGEPGTLFQWALELRARPCR